MTSKETTPTIQQIPVHLNFHQRKLRYEQIRKRIFSKDEPAPVLPLPSPLPNSGVRQRYKSWKKLEKSISESIIDKSGDTRRFAKVEIGGVSIEGLLDSGASISCLGHNGIEFANSLNIKIIQMNSHVKTANKASANIVGRFSTNIKFKNVTRKLTFFIVPSLSQKLYLGVNFWDAFGLWSKDICEIDLQGSIRSENSHVLSPEDMLRLNTIVKNFPSFEEQGLGRTELIEHRIDTGDDPTLIRRQYKNLYMRRWIVC